MDNHYPTVDVSFISSKINSNSKFEGSIRGATSWGSPDWYDEAVGIIGGRDYDLGQLKNSKMRI